MPMKVTLTIPDEIASMLGEHAAHRGTTIEGMISSLIARTYRAKKASTRSVVAAGFLRDVAAERHTWTASDLMQRAREAGVSRTAIFEAKRSMTVPVSRQMTDDGVRWCWDLSHLARRTTPPINP